jgi:hypothetical protein
MAEQQKSTSTNSDSEFEPEFGDPKAVAAALDRAVERNPKLKKFFDSLPGSLPKQ